MSKFPASLATQVAKQLCDALRPLCLPNQAEGRPYLIVAGSLRRRCPEVSDLEILYVSAHGQIPDGLFTTTGSLVDHQLNTWLADGTLTQRLATNGTAAWGRQNKLATHVATGLPVDFFASTPDRWYNQLVCRTGSKDTNVRLATAAKARGLTWHPYSNGFSIADPALAPNHLSHADLIVRSERAAFDLAGLPYLEPWDR